MFFKYVSYCVVSDELDQSNRVGELVIEAPLLGVGFVALPGNGVSSSIVNDHVSLLVLPVLFSDLTYQEYVPVV